MAPAVVLTQIGTLDVSFNIYEVWVNKKISVALADKKFCLLIGNWDRNRRISWTGSNSSTEIRSTSGEMRYSVSWLLCISGHGGRLLSPGCYHHGIVLQVMSSLETSPIALCEYYEPDTILMTCINTRESAAPFNSTSNFASFSCVLFESTSNSTISPPSFCFTIFDMQLVKN